MIEEWKDIKGYEGFYQVSNYGIVKSIERKVKNGRGYRIVKEKIRKLSNNSNGYPLIILSKSNKLVGYILHQLVWEHFGDVDRCSNQIDHIDNCKDNCRIDNLQLLSRRNNIIKSIDKTKTSSKYIGVSWNKNEKKWISYINKNKKRKFLGYYDDEYEAHLAYKKEIMNYGK